MSNVTVHYISISSLPELKQLNWLSLVGLLMVLCGEGLRKAAMLTAGSNFNHIVQNEKAHSHVLVTSGVYSYFRHPSYVGWFYWSTGTQVSYNSLSLQRGFINSEIRLKHVCMHTHIHTVEMFQYCFFVANMNSDP